MKFLQNLVNRMFNHWQSTLIGIIIGVCTWMLYKREMTVIEWGTAIGTIVTLKNILINKDPDKIANKLPPKNEP